MIHEREARQYVLDRCPAVAAVELPLAEAIGCVLTTEVRADEDVPPFVNSAVDGYAVRAADVASLPARLTVVGEIPAGSFSDHQLASGEAMRIMTGAPLPAGADAVAMVEHTSLDGATVTIDEQLRPGTAVRGVGDDVRRGTLLYPAGTVLRPAVAGVLASVNVRRVGVHRRLRVAVLSTGDELVVDGAPLRPGQIRESNKTMLAPLIAGAGCEVVDCGVVGDQETLLEGVLRTAAAQADAIVTSGGVSMGDYDVVKAVLSRIADMRWMQIAIKPAKPLAFGLLDGVPVFGLPGNPVSSLVSFELFARPALLQMMGHPNIDRPAVVAVADEGLPRNRDGKTHYMRVNGGFRADGRYHVRSVGAQGSHQLEASSLADALAAVPDGDGIAAGGDVSVMLL